MTLTDLANHICEQCGMNDSDDVAAAQMFLQRRLEMIWNSQLWRCSLIEATLTINPDGSTTLADTAWIPARGTLLLPAAFESVIAVRADSHAINVASLESYFKTDTDWLDMQGDPTEYQVLKSAVWEFAAPTNVALSPANAADAAAVVNLNTVDSSGVSTTANSVALAAPISASLSPQRIDSGSKPATKGNVSLVQSSPLNLAAVTYTGSPQPSAVIPVTAGDIYTFTPGASESGATLTNGTQQVLLQPGTPVTVVAQGSQLVIALPNLIPNGATYGGGGRYYVGGLNGAWNYNILWGANEAEINIYANQGAGQSQTVNLGGGALIYSTSLNTGIPLTCQIYAANPPFTASVTQWTPLLTVLAGANAFPLHQRLRLTTMPQVSVNLRVIGKTVCPILGAYDSAPINNVEPCLMAFARADMLLRARQNGKAQIAMQEGTTLLAQIARSEAFQQSGRFQIAPDGGFGGDNAGWTQPNSLHPL